MRTVTFQSVLNGVAAKLGMDPLRDLNPARAASLTEYINTRLVEGWKWEFWPEWTVTEQRYFAPVWAAGGLPQRGDFRFFHATGKYYQCLVACGDLPPASLDANHNYVLNAAFWMEAARSYAGADYSATAAYPMGAVVRNPVDGLFYARAGTLRTVNAGTAAANRDWIPTGLANDLPQYNATLAVRLVDAAGVWELLDADPSNALLYFNAGNFPTPDQVTAWTVDTGAGPGPTFLSAFTVPDPSNADYWSVLIPFDSYVAYEQPGRTPLGEVKRVTRRDPRVFPDRPGKISVAPSADGMQVLDPCAPAAVWVTFRLRPPQFTTVLYRASENVTAGTVRYWPAASGGTGECYTALQDQTPAAQAPSNAAFWRRISFPEILANFVKRAAFADALTDQKQQDRKTNELETALAELADASDRELAGQEQFDRAEAQTYGG